MKSTIKQLLAIVAIALAAQGAPAAAQDFGFGAGIEALKKKVVAKTAVKPASVPTLRPWMHADVGAAWSQGYQGQGTNIIVVDDFTSGSRLSGDLGTGRMSLRHGEWTRDEARMIAPGANVRTQDYGSGASVALGSGLNVANLSYGIFAPSGYSVSQIRWSSQESSLISYGKQGRAVISKAAGNDGVAVGAANASGAQDYLNSALVGAPSAIFVGALERNGTPTSKARIASYSNRAGSNATVQNQFLVVGVEGSKTGLYGTSFAAPVVSGYSAILGSKFSGASPVQITNRLLSTARQDTILNYNAAVHGRGEASLSRALAPASIQ